MFDRVIIFGNGRNCERLIYLLKQFHVRIIDVIDDEVDIDNSKRKIDYSVLLKNRIGTWGNVVFCLSETNWKKRIRIKRYLVDSLGLEPKNVLYFDAIIYQLYIQEYSGNRQYRKFITTDNNVDSRICFCLLGGLVLGGVELRVLALCEELLKNNKEIYILSKNADNELDVDRHLKKNIINVTLDFENIYFSVKRIVDLIISILPCTIVTNQPDYLLLATYIVKKIYPEKIRIISIVSGSADYIYEEYKKFNVKSDLYIGVSKDIACKLTDNWAERNKVLSMTVPFPCAKMLERQYSLEKQMPIRIGYAGRLDGFEGSQKRMDLILKTLVKLSELGINYHMEIAGEGIAEIGMRNFISEHGLSKNVLFCGRVAKENIQDFWKQQDIGINLADYEGRSISIVEAMGGGAVPIVTDTSGVREDIVDGENGFIVPIGNYEMAVERILFLDKNRNLLPIMGKKAHDVVWPKSRMEDHILFWNKILWGKDIIV